MSRGGGMFARMMFVRAASLCWNAKFRGVTLEYCKVTQFKHYRLLGTIYHAGLGQDDIDSSSFLPVKSADADDSDEVHRKPWLEADDNALILASQNRTPIGVVSTFLDRTQGALRQRALKLGISLGADDNKRRDSSV